MSSATGAFDAAPPLGGKRQYHDVSISGDGTWVVAASQKNMVDLWSMPRVADDGKIIPGEGPHRAFRAGTSKKPINAVAFSPDGRRVAAACADCGLYLWEMPREMGTRKSDPIGEREVHWGHLFGSNALAWSRDGKQIVSMGADCRLVVFEARTGKHVVVEGTKRTFNTLAIHPIERHVAAGTDDDLIWIWDLAPDPPRRVLAYPMHDGWWKRFLNRVTSVAWSPDGRTLAACASKDTAVHLFRYPDLKKMMAFKPLDEPATRVVFGPNETTLAVGGARGSLVLVDLSSRKTVAAARLPGGVKGLAWRAPWLVVACGDGHLYPFHVRA